MFGYALQVTGVLLAGFSDSASSLPLLFASSVGAVLCCAVLFCCRLEVPRVRRMCNGFSLAHSALLPLIDSALSRSLQLAGLIPLDLHRQTGVWIHPSLSF